MQSVLCDLFHLVSLTGQNVKTFFSLSFGYIGALELADVSCELPGLKWMPGLRHWKVTFCEDCSEGQGHLGGFRSQQDAKQPG